jgi:hypothetical protein
MQVETPFASKRRFYLDLWNKDPPKACMIKPEATTQHLQIQQWVKNMPLGPYALKHKTTTN